jgi:hypothetical protein
MLPGRQSGIKTHRGEMKKSRRLNEVLGRNHWCFVFFAAFVFIITSKVMQAQAHNLIGKWNVEISFPNGEHRSLRFDAQGAGKGSLVLSDAQSKVWQGAKSSDAKWAQEGTDSVTFSGAVEFPLGNVGRDPGTLSFKGKFESSDLITGEVEFSPSLGDRPSRHGTFKAMRGESGKQ